MCNIDPGAQSLVLGLTFIPVQHNSLAKQLRFSWAIFHKEDVGSIEHRRIHSRFNHVGHSPDGLSVRRSRTAFWQDECEPRHLPCDKITQLRQIDTRPLQDICETAYLSCSFGFL